MLKKNILICLVLMILVIQTEAQNKYSLSIVNLTTNYDIRKIVSYKTHFSDTIQRNKELQNVKLSLFKAGYLSASIDSLDYDSLDLKAYVNIGKKFKYFIITNSIILDDHDNASNKKDDRKVFSNYSELQTNIENLIRYYENNGYPFVNIRFDSVKISDSNFVADLVVNINSKYIIDSIIVKGNASSSIEFIQNYIHINLQSPYNEAQIRKIPRKIKELDFLKETRPPEIEFYKNKTKLILNIDKVKANQFDGVIGIMPNDAGKVLFTGDVKLILLNSFNRGEMLALKWHKFDKSTQDLKISLNYPFLLNSPLGIDLDYSLYKKDTSYVTNIGNMGFRYIFEGNNYLKAFFEKQSTTLLNNKINENDSVLPFINGSKINLYGLEFKYQNIDRLVNPRRGFQVQIVGSVGDKEIVKNKYLSDSLYRSFELKSSNYVYHLEFSYFLPVFERSCFYFNTKSASIINKYLFENELFRIGGLRTLRGFDEETILASFYAILTIEYRYLIDEYSYINVFWNGCHYEMNTISKFSYGNPFGFGAGINFKTKLGIFSINYALGKQEKEPLYVKRAKIHFGIVNYF